MKGEIRMLKLDLEYKKEILICRLKGILNKKNSYKLDCYINPILRKHNIKYLVYNLDGLKDIDEKGIDAFLTSKWTIKENKGKIAFCKGKPNILEKIKKLRIPNYSCERKVNNSIS